MKSSLQLQREAYSAVEDLRDRLKEKLDLIDAEETHGEELDDDVIAEDFQTCEDIIKLLDSLDLSYIS